MSVNIHVCTCDCDMDTNVKKIKFSHSISFDNYQPLVFNPESPLRLIRL